MSGFAKRMTMENDILTTCARCGGTGSEVDHCAIGERARAAREKSGESLRAVAEKCRCSPPHLSDLEHGRRGWKGPAAHRVLEYLGLYDELEYCGGERPKTMRFHR